MKSYTDLEQSKKLAKILPLESADMFYDGVQDLYKEKVYNIPTDGSSITVRTGHVITDKGIKANLLLPCWSLAALLNILPKNLNIGRPSLNSNYKGYYWIQYYDEFMKPNNYKTECFNNPVDACVDMIEKLHELNLL
jgi:hypothetical protein